MLRLDSVSSHLLVPALVPLVRQQCAICGLSLFRNSVRMLPLATYKRWILWMMQNVPNFVPAAKA
jgi:hypothetical protein